MSQPRIVYMDGYLADQIGSKAIQDIAAVIASISGTPVDILTHGPSRSHEHTRYTAQPDGKGGTTRKLIERDIK